MENLEYLEVESLSEVENNTTEGGFLPLVAVGLGLWGGVALMAYGAGYLVGTIENTLQ